MGKTGRTIKAVEISFEIVEALHELGGAGVTEIANHLNRSKSTVHAHLSTLLKNGYVVRDDDEYQLSLYYLNLGQYARVQVENYDVVRTELQNLAEQTGETAQFAVEERGEVVYLLKMSGEKAVQTASDIGKRLPMHSTSLGKAMLAYMNKRTVEEIIETHGLPRQTPQTITNREDLYNELENIRKCGYATDIEENVRGIRCISTPILGDDEDVLGAISVSGPARRLIGEAFEQDIPDKVQRSANVIEVNSSFS